MSSADDIRRWSEELARDPASLVFLELGDTLRREGQLDLAMKIAGRGLARHAGNASANDLVLRIAADRTALADRAVRADQPVVLAEPVSITPSPAGSVHELGLEPAPEDEAQAVLVDGQGLVVAGSYLDPDGRDVAEEVAAQLNGISDEAVRAARHLDLGTWRTLSFETDTSVVGIAPAEAGGLVFIAAPRSMPVGMLRRLLARCVAQAAVLLGAGGSE